jgi:hypothetical protein
MNIIHDNGGLMVSNTGCHTVGLRFESRTRHISNLLAISHRNLLTAQVIDSIVERNRGHA